MSDELTVQNPGYVTKRIDGHYTERSETEADGASVEVGSFGSNLAKGHSDMHPALTMEIKLDANDEVVINADGVTIYFAKPTRVVPLFNDSVRAEYEHHAKKYR